MRSETNGRQRRYLRAEETKPEGKGERGSEYRIVPWSEGNLPPGTLRKEVGAIGWSL